LFLLQAAEIALVKDAAEKTGLEGWALVAVYAFVAIGFVVVRLILPGLIKKENKDVVKNITREEFHALAAESEKLTGENTSILQRLENIDASLDEAKKDREWFNSASVERFNMITNTVQDMKKQSDLTLQKALEAHIYDKSAPSLGRMESLIIYIKRGWDGNCLNFAIPELICPNEELWNSNSLHVQRHDHSNVANETAYSEALDKIKRSLH
jgi:hypothetical protein